MGELSPIVVVGAPGSGAELLVRAFARASGTSHPRDPSANLLDAVPGIAEHAAAVAHHALGAGDAPAFGAAAAAALPGALVPWNLKQAGATGEADPAELRPILGGARTALRVPFVHAVFPAARFVFVHRDPGEALELMRAAWTSGRSVSIEVLDGWEGPAWSLPLIPEWRSLAGAGLEAIVAEQWRAITERLLDDLEALAPEAWAATSHDALLADPRRELRRLCTFLSLTYDGALLSPLEVAAREAQRRPPVRSAELAEVLPQTEAAAARAAELLAPTAPEERRSRPLPGGAFGSVATGTFMERLRRIGGSLMITTYQTGKLIIAREHERLLNTHFREFDKPMGIASSGDRLALGTRTEVWDFRDAPAVAKKLDDRGLHDACFLPRNRHYTGDIAIHELAFAGGQLWLLATSFSCLATLDADHSFVPRWKPPFISRIALGDRCHLNGMAVVDDRIKYVTALGTSDEPGGWREGKAAGGVIMDVPSGEIVAPGLSMPHSPRWHNGALWVLESGRGELCRIDLDTGKSHAIAQLPGFTRGLVLHGRTAFIGLSQIRESSTFGDLPITKRLQERVCGVWMVDLGSGRIEGFLRFEDIVQEIFDIALLTGRRYPELGEPGSQATASTFALP